MGDVIVDFKERPYIEHQIYNIKQSTIFKVLFSLLVGSNDGIDPVNVAADFSINTR